MSKIILYLTEVIDCRTGAYKNAETRTIPDGQAERISEMPDYVVLGTRRGGGLIVESRHNYMGAPNTIVLGGNYDRQEVSEGFYVPSNSVVSRGNSKDHEIKIMGRTADNTGSVVHIKGVCVDNAPRK